MADQNQAGSAGQAGSPSNVPADGSNAGQTSNEPNYKELYENLESKLGKQGEELGEYRNFFKDAGPLLSKLDASPDLVKAILDGKIDETLAKSALEGKINLQQAEAIQQADDKIKNKMGDQNYANSSPEEIAKLIAAEVAKSSEKMEAKMSEMEEVREFESSVNEFIARTSDFPQYAIMVDEWLEDHPEITDISVAYYAIKGQLSEKDAKKKADEDAAEYQKNQALNVGGGNSRSTFIPANDNLIDSLISTSRNPNVIG